ncbi:AcrB/AcrD/AcrF family protein [Chryseobacterium taichungense]|uniref:AcrB/AcrD/AcrF family protein n=1 Tax=Chryseobacterium taichungense TaxID=295069 RepID=A0A1H7YIT3_9FLAO|nr:efflux RND transporter permease subunit [Chryseobacterium taichungense]SEM46146.1 AcrB/AcrD/AcrF family protein [Chryseobacterium taichungense]
MSFVVLSVIPSVIVGSLVLIYITGSTLNLQSYIGMITSLGVSVSNAVLLNNQADYYRKLYQTNALHSARMAAASRIRPVLMTALAMLAGMISMAIGIRECSEQLAPLGRAIKSICRNGRVWLLEAGFGGIKNTGRLI